MANSLLKLTVESSEYDAKLKKAAEGIRHLADVAHKGDGDLTGLEKSTLDYIKSVGEMETKSRSAAGQVRELESTYKELKVVYDQLNEVEKADEGGKALAASLETLKQRAQDARKGLDDASKSLQENADAGKEDSSVLAQLASKFTVNIDALKLFDIGLQAAKAALDVAKDAFFASEATVDEWGRTMQSAQGLYEGFLNAINNGDISGYLSRMDDIVKAAREAYNALDTLQTMKTIQGPGMSKQQTENDRIRQMIQTGRYIAPVDGRKNAVWNGQEMKNGQVLAPEQIRILERQLQGGLQKMTGFVKNEVDQTGKAIDAYYNSLAKQNGMSLSEFKKGTSTWEEFRQKIRGYEEYKKWDTQARTEFARQGGQGNVNFDKSNPYAEYRKWGTFRVDKMGENSFNELVGLIRQRDQQSSQIYSTMAQSYRTMNRAEGLTVRQIMGGGSGGSGGSGGTNTPTYQPGSLAEAMADVQKYTKLWQEAGDAVRDSFLPQLIAAEEHVRKLKEDMAWAKDLAMGKYSDQGDFTKGLSDARSVRFNTTLDDKDVAKPGTMLLDDKAMAVVTKQIEEITKPAKEDKKKSALESPKQLVSGLTQVAGGLQQMGITIPEEVTQILNVVQGLMTVIEGVNMVIGVTQTAALTANTTAIIALTSAVWANTVTPSIFANGGIVPHAANGYFIPGRRFSGDTTPIMANAGELVLNKAQQGNLASQLNGGWDNLNLTATIRGEQIRLAVNNNGKRTGRGEMVQTNRR